jgi:peptidoglycan/xylan/chitin deacetylase (PgdA/CDA1 family)
MMPLLRATLRWAAGSAYWASPHFFPLVRGRVLILMYHRVIPRADFQATFVQPGLYVTPDTFERHLRFIADRFDVLSFADLLRMWDAGGWDDDAHYCVITFDDGWLDNYTYAYPLLRSHGLPATIFLPTDFVGTSRWLWFDRLGALLHRRGTGTTDDWDRHIERAKTMSDDARNRMLDDLECEAGGHYLARRRFVDWDQVREMSGGGISFGSHTRTHANLTRLPPADLDRELGESLQALRREHVQYVPVLAYPNGDYTDAVVEAARAAGYCAAVTTHPGLESRRPADRFELNRIGVHDEVTRSVPQLALHVARQA